MLLRSRNLYAFFCSFLVLAFALSAQQKQPEPPSTPILGFSRRTPPLSTRSKPRFIDFLLPNKYANGTAPSPPNLTPPLPTAIISSLILSRTNAQAGWEDVTLRRYDVCTRARRSISLEMTAPLQFTASLREDAYDADPTRKIPPSPLLLWLFRFRRRYRRVIYAHSGNPEDYDLLRKNGISVKGKIVLVRYSNPYSLSRLQGAHRRA